MLECISPEGIPFYPTGKMNLDGKIEESYEEVRLKIDNIPLMQLRGYLNQIHDMDQFTKHQKQKLVMYGIERVYWYKKEKPSNNHCDDCPLVDY